MGVDAVSPSLAVNRDEELLQDEGSGSVADIIIIPT